MQLNDYQQKAIETAVYGKRDWADFIQGCVCDKTSDYVNLSMGRNEYDELITALERFGLYYTALGLAGEGGEVANKAKKVYRDDDGKLFPERQEQMKKELGGVG